MSYSQPGYAQQSHGRSSGPRAGFWRRLGAVIVDAIILGILEAILIVGLGRFGYFLFIVAAIAYYVVLEGGPTGQTLGKKALGIRVISFESGGQIGYARAFVRYIGRIVSAVVIFLGYLWMLWDRERQCWHDKFAGDVVVPVSAYPLPVRL